MTKPEVLVAVVVGGLVVGALGACGTADPFDPTDLFGGKPRTGDLGVVQYSWNGGVLGCTLGCDTTSAMGAGAVAFVQLHDHKALPSFTVSSDDPQTAECSVRAGTASPVRCEAHRAGRFWIVLTRDDGSVLDRLPIDVEDIALIELAEPGLYREQLTMLEGIELRPTFRTLDRAGRVLRGVGGLSYQLSGEIGAAQLTIGDAISTGAGSFFFGGEHDSARIRAHAVGAGRIEVRAPQADPLVIPVSVVTPRAIARVALESDGFVNGAQSARPDQAFAGIKASAFSGSDERIYSPSCEWSISPDDGDIELKETTRDTARLVARAPAKVQVTCKSMTVGRSIDIQARRTDFNAP